MSVATESIVAKVQECFNFTVDKFPLSGPDGMQTPWYALFRSDTNKVVGKASVTRQYVPHTVDDVVALVESAEKALDGIADVDCYFRDGHYVTIRPTKEQRFEAWQNDAVFPRFNIGFGYDGKSCRSTLGVYRLTCANLISFRTVKEAVVRFRHTSNLRKHMDELIATFASLRDGWDAVTNTIQRMESNRVNLAAMLDQLYGKPDETSKRAITIHKDRTAAIVNRLLGEQMKLGRPAMGSDFMVSGWEFYNAVQGYIQHDTTRKGRNANSAAAKVLLALESPTVSQAELLALAV